MEIVWIIEAKYVSEFVIFLKFNDGTEGTVDLADKLKGPVFESLKDISYFKSFSLKAWTIEWTNGADLAPEFLYNEVIKTQINTEVG